MSAIVTSPTIVTTVTLKPRKAQPFFNRHPWVLDSAIGRTNPSPDDGAVVRLVADNGQFVAWGVYNGRSRIRVRLYSWNEAESLDEGWLRSRLESAARLRAGLSYGGSSDAVRLVSSEGDGLSGLVIERYGPHLLVQLTALAMAVRLPQIIEMAAGIWRPQSITVRTDREMNRAEGLAIEEATVWGERPAGSIFITEHGVRYGIDLEAGQKTGFYLDQRDNRLAAAKLARDRRLLDACCYTGGFSLAAPVCGGARSTLGVDSSARAIATAQANAQLNSLTRAQFEVGDVFQRLESLEAAGERFGVVVLDPPKFARSRDQVPQALRAYHHLNRLAVGLLEPDGWLVSCSCSGHVSRDDLLFTLADVAQHTKRSIQMVESRGAAADHPVSVSCLDSEYLKCLVCRVA